MTPTDRPRPLTTVEYEEAIRLCRAIVDASQDRDGGPLVAGSFLGHLTKLLSSTVPSWSPCVYCGYTRSEHGQGKQGVCTWYDDGGT